MKTEKKVNDTVVEMETMEKENTALFEKLTNKNRQYMVKLNRRLEIAGMTAEERTIVFNDMLKEIVAEQNKGVTARQLYGTVTERSNELIASPVERKQEKGEPSENWKLYLDGSLLLGGMFALVTGLSSVFGGDPQAGGMGLITLLLNFLIGGGVVLAITKNAPVPGEKGGLIRYLLVSIASMFVWIILMTLTSALIPPTINVFLPGTVTLIIGAIAFGLKFYLKKKLNIKGTLI
ncbi:DUF1129 domain-containing protein [Lacticigenium naphthae]|uniref:DUF1129 domain-containing protein n=1 Tax=Lacticigenium naphthae TaxID=515351 RepID=UPI000419D21F|nr:DUF1129 family protein [Lacticigenium naphthae]